MSIIHTSPLPDVEIPEVTLGAYVMRNFADFPEAVALVDGPSGRSYTFAEFQGHVAKLAGGLQAKGLGPGSVVALMAPNLPEYAIAFHAIARAGATATTLNPLYTPDELRHQLQDSGAVLLITVGLVLESAQAAVEGTKVTEIAVIGEPIDGTTPFAALYGDAIEQVDVDPAEHVVVLPYSSGTTGLSKGVMLTHRNLVANLAQCTTAISYDRGEVALAALPFFHIYGMQVLMNGLLAEGVTVVSVPRFDLVEALELVQKHKITRWFAVPPMVLAMAKHPIFDNYDLSSLRQVFSGAAPLGAELGEEAAARVGCEVIQGYGMTELSPVSHCTVSGQGKAGSSGVTVSNTECRIVDTDSGDDLGIDAEGELWVRGPQVMKGYLANDEATKSTLDADGWLHTGDVGRIDGDGHIYIVDRVKELIKYKGFQVPPAELEALLTTHPAVADAAVIGIPDDEAGELAKAFIVLKPDTEASADDIQEFVKGHVASYKQIRLVEFIEEIPKSASGKILRRFLRDG